MSSFMPTRRMMLRGTLLAGAALPLSGCMSVLGGTTGSLDAVRPARPSILVVTNRKPSGNGTASPFYTGERRDDVTALRALFDTPPTSLISRATSVLSSSWTITDIEALGEGDAVANVAQRASGRDVLIYVHGYNESFESAVRGGAELADGIRFSGVPVVFTWPSKAGLLDYGYDRESALYSRDALQSLLTTLIDTPTIGRVNIVAHSMGGLLTLEVLRELTARRSPDQLAGRLGALVFAAPDVDADVFTSTVRRLGPLAQKLTLITALNDRALEVSRRLAGGVARAGAADRDTIERLGVRVADASEYGWGIIRHDLFLSNGEVRQVVQRAVERGRSI